MRWLILLWLARSYGLHPVVAMPRRAGDLLPDSPAGLLLLSDTEHIPVASVMVGALASAIHAFKSEHAPDEAGAEARIH